MYVGPWQEYALSKKKGGLEPSKLKAKSDAAAFKSHMESAILKSLDPLSAARALNAMQEVLRDHTVPDMAASGADGDAQKRRPPRLIVGQTTAYKLALPSSNSASPHFSSGQAGSMHARDSNGGFNLTPNSVRSTVSEPSLNMSSIGPHTRAPDGSLSARNRGQTLERKNRGGTDVSRARDGGGGGGSSSCLSGSNSSSKSNGNNSNSSNNSNNSSSSGGNNSSRSRATAN